MKNAMNWTRDKVGVATRHLTLMDYAGLLLIIVWATVASGGR